MNSTALPLRRAEIASHWRRYLVTPPADVQAATSMLSPAERAILYGLARDYWSGEGVIVDAGIFLGGSTLCFGRGVQESRRSLQGVGHPIVSFEYGSTNLGMITIFERKGIGKGLKVGDSFVPLLEEAIAPVRDVVDLRIGDVLDQGQIDQPIEILFLDLIKKDTINEFVASEWFPRLIPGRSIVIQQDYLIESLPFIRVQQEYFASKFVFLGEAGSTAIFRCVEEITPAEVAEMRERTRDPMEQIRLGSLAVQRSGDRARQVLLHAGVVRQLVSLFGVEAGKLYWDTVRKQYPDLLMNPAAPARLRRVEQSLDFIMTSDGSKRSLLEAARIAHGFSSPNGAFVPKLESVK